MSSEVMATAVPTDNAMSSNVAREMRVPRDVPPRLGLLVAVTAGVKVGLTGLVQVRRNARPHHFDAGGDRSGRALLGLRQSERSRPRVGLLVPDGQPAGAFRQSRER